MQNTLSIPLKGVKIKTNQIMRCSFVEGNVRRVWIHVKLWCCMGVFVFLLAVVAAFTCVGCQSTIPSTLTELSTEKPRSVLSPGDIVTITFAGAAELNLVQKIRLDGKLNLPLVGEVNAAGKSIAGLQQELTRLYKPHLRSAAVLVGLQTSAAVVYVSGAVNQQGKIILDRPMTALEAIMEAGGFAQGLANSKKVVLIREEDGKHLTRTLDLSPKGLSRQTNGVTYLKPYDMLIVPEKMF